MGGARTAGAVIGASHEDQAKDILLNVKQSATIKWFLTRLPLPCRKDVIYFRRNLAPPI
jgi:hypothetical protein